jgi:hypothetical protein
MLCIYDMVNRGRTDNEGEAGTAAKDCSPDKGHGKEHTSPIYSHRSHSDLVRTLHKTHITDHQVRAYKPSPPFYNSRHGSNLNSK